MPTPAIFQHFLLRIKLAKQKSIRLEVDDDITAIRTNANENPLGVYAIDIEFELKSISDQTIRVPYHVIEIYVGQLSVTLDKEHTLRIVNEPGFDVSKVDGGEVVKWKLLQREVSRIEDKIEVPTFEDDVESAVTATEGWERGRDVD